MPELTEQSPQANQNQLPPERGAMVPAIGRTGLWGVEVSARHFYDGDEHSISETPAGEHKVIISSASKEGTLEDNVVGSGADVEVALYDSLEKMHSLETVRTRSLARIEMTNESYASFTTLEHYSPRVAPSRTAHPMPGYLESLFTGSGNSDHTYRNTVEQEGWQTELRTVIDGYLQDDPGGQRLVESLKIRSLSHLTPEQAVKLSAAFVQNVSKYSHEDVGSAALTRADQSTAVELLKEGIANKDDPTWKGNGVCRNVASNVKAVFEALKGTQAELSMLNNTYAVYGRGADGAGYADSRADAFTLNNDPSGHAWNTFVTVGKDGSTVSTIIDATWALDTDAGSAMKHLDQTEVRAAGQLMQLFEKSEVKEEAIFGLTDYVRKVIRTTDTNSRLSGREGIREYVTTEYLKATAQLPEMPDGFSLPRAIATSAYRMRGKLEHNEVETLFALDEADGGFEQELIKATIVGYDTKREVGLPAWKSAENLLFDDNKLQTLALDAVGAERAAQLSEESGKFRARLREVNPETLPPFNASERQADAQELGYFASENGVHDKNPTSIMKRFHSILKKTTGDDSVYEAIVAGRSDYDLAKNFSTIIDATKQSKNLH